MRNDFRITAIGAGIDARQHLSIEAIEALRSIRKVYYSGELSGIEEVIDDNRIEFENLSTLALYGEPRATTYARFADHIFRELPAYHSVAWMTAGNPYFIDGGTYVLRERAGERGVAFHVVPAISSVDLLVGMLNIDVSRAGLQVFDANALFLRPTPLNNIVPALILQLARAGTRLQTLGYQIKPQGLTYLEALISQTHGADHKCYVVTVRSLAHEQQILEARATTLGALAPLISPWSTLYVPPAVEVTADSARDERMSDHARLLRDFESPLELALRRNFGVRLG